MEIADASNGAKLTKFERYRFLKLKNGQKDVFVRRKDFCGVKLLFLIKIENFYQKNNFPPKNPFPHAFCA